MRNGNQIAGLVAVTWLALGLAGAAHAEPLRIFYFDWAGFGPFLLADDEGFYAEEGLEVQLIPVADTHAAYSGLSSGHVDAIAAAFPDLPYFWTPDDQLVCAFATDEAIGMDGIVADKDIETVSDLKGRTVAFEEGSTTHFYMNVALRQVGLTQGDVEAVEVPDFDALQAFLLGEVDAISTFGAMLIQAAQAPRAHLLTDSSQQPGVIVGCLVTTRERLAARNADFRALARAWDAAVAHVEAHPNEAIEIMAARIGDAHADPKVFSEALEQIRFFDRQRNLEYFGTPDRPGQAYDTAQTAIDIWTQLGAVAYELTRADLIAPSIWDE